MNLKAYGTEMLRKQLGYAEKKGNDSYAEMLRKEIIARESAKPSGKTSEMSKVKDPVGLAGINVPAMNTPSMKNVETDTVTIKVEGDSLDRKETGREIAKVLAETINQPLKKDE